MKHSLPQAPGYQFTDPHLGKAFNTRGRNINLDTITDTTIEQLLEDEPDYWGAKFKKKTTSKKKEKVVDEEPTE